MAQEYRIRVQGTISQRWTGWFDDMAIEIEQSSDGSQVTILRGHLADQAALRGILTKLWNLNLILISVYRIETGAQ